MTTPNIAGLCERLRASPLLAYRKEAADTLEHQAAEIERLREELNGAKHELRLVIRDIDAALTGEDHE